MKPKGFYNVFIIGLIFEFFIPIPVSAENLHNAEGLQILIAQQSAKGLWDMPNDMPSPPAVQTGTADISTAPNNDIRIILLDIASKTKKMADMAIDKADDKLTPIKAPVYDPTKDISVSSGNKAVDVAQVDKAADDFQKGQTWGKSKIDTQQTGQQSAVQQSDTYIGKTQSSPPTTQLPHQEPPTYYPPSGDRQGGRDWTDLSKNKSPVIGGSSQQSGSSWAGGTTGTAPTVPVDTRTVGCNTTTKSGADAPATITVNVGRGAGTVKFYYEMYNVKDRMIVQYGGQNLYDTGCVSGSRPVPLNLSGASDSVVVMVQPQCEKKDSTKWDFKIECPQSSGSQSTVPTSSGGTSTVPQAVIAELSNQARENVHIFVEGQDNFGTQNRFPPGENRKVQVKVPVQGGRIKFIAGRNGQKLSECLWDYTSDSKSRVPVVTFYEPNRLSCVTGLR